MDRERGILLRYAAVVGDREFAVASVGAVTVDAPIDLGMFGPPVDS